jgi:hypothetical protein
VAVWEKWKIALLLIAIKNGGRILRYCPARWILPKLGSFDRSSLKSEALRFLKNSTVPNAVRSL